MVKRIAVVGSGVSGSLCARLLATKHEVTLFEAGEVPGGHTHTADVELDGQTWSVDTGFMVFNDRTYPNFIRMLDLLGIESRPSDMSFSVHCSRTGLEYQGSSLNGLFAQRRNLFRPSFFRMLAGIKQFNLLAKELLDAPNDLTLEDWVDEHSGVERSNPKFLDPEVVELYLLPMTSAIWSAPAESMLKFPAKFLARFMENHGLLQIYDRPQWRTIRGGARQYLAALLDPLADAVRTNAPVTNVCRTEDGVSVSVRGDVPERFDAVVLASHAPQSLRMLGDATPLERQVLGAFRYQSNEAYVHTDTNLLPRRTRAWASWNYRTSSSQGEPASVTYDLSRLQGLRTAKPLLQTLNPAEAIESSKTVLDLRFEHPLFDGKTHEAQQKLDVLHQDGKIYFCGAYWGYGFHEDGVVSALNVCRHFGIELKHLTQPCIAASTKVKSST